ncbi:MAG: hypothetical protein FD131_393 [Rhodocyclaceae bacterium]|nr:MAG: hypothetical protein FD131_393 [Rhodocyclaceae bacterium]
MDKNIDELLAKIRVLQDELEEEYRQTRDEWAQKRIELAEEFLRQQRRYKTGLFRFLLRTRLLVALTAPLIYLGWIPFMFMDIFVSIYQTICFPVYRIPKVKRSEYMVFDRRDLPYLNVIEKFNCFYCSYGNGVAAYTREVAARTEQYWCPIKHARRIKAAHDFYPNFCDFGDAEAYQQGLNRLRRQYEDETR